MAQRVDLAAEPSNLVGIAVHGTVFKCEYMHDMRELSSNGASTQPSNQCIFLMHINGVS